MTASSFLLVGLGNPGKGYNETRHNAGFIMIDHLASQYGCQLSKKKMEGLFCKTRIGGASVILLQPQTYMNKSGECVRRFVDFFDIAVEDILILHDDIDLPLGRVKVVAKGGAGGHNGIKSIAQHLGTNEFSRIKIGVGRPENGGEGKKQAVHKYVLSGFTEDERNIMTDRSELVTDAVDIFMDRGIAACMNTINCKTRNV